MRRLHPYIRRYWHRYAFGMLCTAITASLASFIPLLNGHAIDAAQHGNYVRLAGLAELIIAIAVAVGIARFFSRYVTFNVGRDIEYDLRNDLFEKLTELEGVFYQRLKTGDLMSRMINDLTAVRMLAGMGVLTFINAPLFFIYA